MLRFNYGHPAEPRKPYNTLASWFGVDALCKTLKDKDADVRIEVAKSLGQIGGHQGNRSASIAEAPRQKRNISALQPLTFFAQSLTS